MIIICHNQAGSFTVVVNGSRAKADFGLWYLNDQSRPVDYSLAKLHHSAGAATAPRERRTTTNPRAGHATSPGQKPGPTRITVPQDVSTAGPTPIRNRATIRPTRRLARRTHQLPHRMAPQGSPNAAAAHTLRPARARPHPAATAQSDSDNRASGCSPRRSQH